MQIKHPSLEFLLNELAGDHPNLDRDALTAAAEHVDELAFYACDVGTLDAVLEVKGCLEATLSRNPTPEVKAIMLTGLTWAEVWVDILIRVQPAVATREQSQVFFG